MVNVSMYVVLLIVNITLTAFVEFGCGSPDNSSDKYRRKRVVYGSPLLDFKSFDVVGYFVHISIANGWTWAWHKFVSLFYATHHPSAGSQHCGGALLTPTLVQTACHCLTKQWTPAPNWEPKYQFPIIKNGFEDLLVLHHGHTRVLDFENGVFSKKFVNHIECKMLNHTGEVSYDFGLIVTENPFPEVFWAITRTGNHNFAPVTTIAELALQYYRTVKREAVCLLVGFGKWNYVNRDTSKFGAASPVLMHGWRAVRSYWECYIASMEAKHFLYGKTDKDIFDHYVYNYTNDCSWACTTFFGKLRAVAAPGDSGSPVTCSNQYFAVVSFLKGILWSKVPEWSTTRSVEMVGALGFSMYENSAEYRQTLVESMNAYAKGESNHPPHSPSHATVDPFHPDVFYHVTTAKTQYYAAHSDSTELHCSRSILIGALQILILLNFIRE